MFNKHQKIPLILNSLRRCLIFGTDGLWNMLSPEGAVSLVQATERHNEAALVAGGAPPRDWLNPSKSLVDHALERSVRVASTTGPQVAGDLLEGFRYLFSDFGWVCLSNY